MRWASGRIGIVVLAGALALGCGGGGPQEPMGQFTGDYEAAICRRMLACCGVELAGSTVVDQATCVASLGQVGYGFALADAYVDAGTVAYRGDLAHGCLEAVAALPCGMWQAPFQWPDIPQCDGVYAGKVPAGGSCSSYLECASNICLYDSSGGVACAAPVGLGASCGDYVPCAAGLHCVSNPGGGNRLCQQQALPVGSPCSYQQDCASGLCSTTGTCSEGTSCNGP
jgi:hypothetical protein